MVPEDRYDISKTNHSHISSKEVSNVASPLVVRGLAKISGSSACEVRGAHRVCVHLLEGSDDGENDANHRALHALVEAWNPAK